MFKIFVQETRHKKLKFTTKKTYIEYCTREIILSNKRCPRVNVKNIHMTLRPPKLKTKDIPDRQNLRGWH